MRQLTTQMRENETVDIIKMRENETDDNTDERE